jgi:ketosteroid isomerase-like protein
MRTTFLSTIAFLVLFSCKADKEQIKKEIFETEKAFEAMATEKGIAEAFAFYADEKAVISRGGDTVIIGKTAIKDFYAKKNLNNTTVNWSPDFIEVSSDGELGYTYGKYKWQLISEKGDTSITTGIFHTVWRKQSDGTWKYVWD